MIDTVCCALAPGYPFSSGPRVCHRRMHAEADLISNLVMASADQPLHTQMILMVCEWQLYCRPQIWHLSPVNLRISDLLECTIQAWWKRLFDILSCTFIDSNLCLMPTMFIISWWYNHQHSCWIDCITDVPGSCFTLRARAARASIM